MERRGTEYALRAPQIKSTDLKYASRRRHRRGQGGGMLTSGRW